MQSKKINSSPKLLKVVLKEKRREIIKEWIKSGRVKDTNGNVSSDKEVIFFSGKRGIADEG